MLSETQGGTQRLTQRTASQLRACNTVSFGTDNGWTIAYGKDINQSLIIAVHGNSEIEIQAMIDGKRAPKVDKLNPRG